MGRGRADGSRRAARIAVAIDMPLYAVTAWGSAALCARLVGREAAAWERPRAAVAAIDTLAFAVGIPVVAHTVGRALYERTREISPCRAALAFAGMGAALAGPAAAIVAATAPRRSAGALYALLAVALPVASTAALTRWLQPRVTG